MQQRQTGRGKPKSYGPDIPEITSEQKRTLNECYKELAMAIIAQAAKDGCRRFFCGPNAPIQSYVTERVDGEAIWERIQFNKKHHGTWRAVGVKEEDF